MNGARGHGKPGHGPLSSISPRSSLLMLLFSWALLHWASPFCLKACDFACRRKSICTFRWCDTFVVLVVEGGRRRSEGEGGDRKAEGGRGKGERSTGIFSLVRESPCATSCAGVMSDRDKRHHLAGANGLQIVKELVGVAVVLPLQASTKPRGGSATGFVEILLTHVAKNRIYMAWKPLDR